MIISFSEKNDGLTNLFKWFLAAFFLLCTLVPIVKDNLADIAIIGSLILKWFDWLILILNSDKLTIIDELQFGFLKLASTTMCSWGGQLCSGLLQQSW